MKRSDRIFKIINLLRSGRWTVKALSKRFRICRRTVFRDFEALKELGYELEEDFEDQYFIVADLKKDVAQSIKLLNQISQNAPHKLLSDAIENITAFKILRGL